MQQILVYGDSLTWGIIPDTRRRLAFDERWPGVLEHGLAQRDRRVRVIEDCLNGRRTAWEDPFKPGRNGLVGLEQRIEACSPLALVLLALGTNDVQFVHATDAWHSAEGLAALIRAVRRAPVEPGMEIPAILALAPPPLENPKGAIADKFRGAPEKCVGQAAAFEAVCRREDCAFFDMASVTTASRVDGVHLDADQHRILGEALVEVVDGLLARSA